MPLISPNSSDNIGQLLGRSVWTSSGWEKSDELLQWTSWKAWCRGSGCDTFTNYAFGGNALLFRIFLSVGGIAIPFHSQVSANRIGSYLLPLRYQFDRSVFSCCGAFPSPFTPSSYQDAVQTGELISLRWGWGLLHPVWRFHSVKQPKLNGFANREAQWEFLPVLLRSRAALIQ